MSLTVMEDPRLETVPEEETEEVNVARTTSSGRVSKPPERLGFDVPRHIAAGARSRTPPRSSNPQTPQEGEQARKYRSVDDLDIEGISKMKPADRQAIKDKAMEALQEIRKVIPSDEGPRVPQSPDPQGGEHRLTWDNVGHLQPPLHSTAIRRSTPTVTPRRQFMNEREFDRISRNYDEGSNFESYDEENNGDRRSRAVYSRPYDNTWVVQDTTRRAHDGDFSSDATPPGWGGRERSPAGGRADLTLPSRGENQPLARVSNAVNWAVEAQKERQRVREEDQREFEKLQRRAELLERERMLRRELEAIRSDNDHPDNPGTEQTDYPSTKRTDWTSNPYARHQDGDGGYPAGGGPSGNGHSTGGGASSRGHSSGGGSSGGGSSGGGSSGGGSSGGQSSGGGGGPGGGPSGGGHSGGGPPPPPPPHGGGPPPPPPPHGGGPPPPPPPHGGGPPPPPPPHRGGLPPTGGPPPPPPPNYQGGINSTWRGQQRAASSTSYSSHQHPQSTQGNQPDPSAIHAAKGRVKIFRGGRKEGDLFYNPGPTIVEWLDSVEMFFRTTNITDDATRVGWLPYFTDATCGMGQEIVGVYCQSANNDSYADVKRKLIRQFSKEPITDFGDLMAVVMANSPPIMHKSQVPERTIFALRHIQRIVNAYLNIPIMNHYNPQERDYLQYELERFLTYVISLCHFPRTSAERVLYTDEAQRRKGAMELLDALTGDLMKNSSLPELEQASRAHHIMYSTYLNQTATVLDEKNKQPLRRPPYNRRVHLVEEQQASTVGGQPMQDHHLQGLDNNATPIMEDPMIGAVARSQPSQTKPEKPPTDKNKQPFCVLCKKLGHATRRCRHRPTNAGENNTCFTCGGSNHRSADHHLPKIKHLPASNGICSNCRGVKHHDSSCPSHYVRYVEYQPTASDFQQDETAAQGT